MHGGYIDNGIGILFNGDNVADLVDDMPVDFKTVAKKDREIKFECAKNTFYNYYGIYNFDEKCRKAGIENYILCDEEDFILIDKHIDNSPRVYVFNTKEFTLEQSFTPKTYDQYIENDDKNKFKYLSPETGAEFYDQAVFNLTAILFNKPSKYYGHYSYLLYMSKSSHNKFTNLYSFLDSIFNYRLIKPIDGEIFGSVSGQMNKSNHMLNSLIFSNNFHVLLDYINNKPKHIEYTHFQHAISVVQYRSKFMDKPTFNCDIFQGKPKHIHFSEIFRPTPIVCDRKDNNTNQISTAIFNALQSDETDITQNKQFATYIHSIDPTTMSAQDYYKLVDDVIRKYDCKYIKTIVQVFDILFDNKTNFEKNTSINFDVYSIVHNKNKKKLKTPMFINFCKFAFILYDCVKNSSMCSEANIKYYNYCVLIHYYKQIQISPTDSTNLDFIRYLNKNNSYIYQMYCVDLALMIYNSRQIVTYKVGSFDTIFLPAHISTMLINYYINFTTTQNLTSDFPINIHKANHYLFTPNVGFDGKKYTDYVETHDNKKILVQIHRLNYKSSTSKNFTHLKQQEITIYLHDSDVTSIVKYTNCAERSLLSTILYILLRNDGSTFKTLPENTKKPLKDFFIKYSDVSKINSSLVNINELYTDFIKTYNNDDYNQNFNPSHESFIKKFIHNGVIINYELAGDMQTFDNIVKYYFSDVDITGVGTLEFGKIDSLYNMIKYFNTVETEASSIINVQVKQHLERHMILYDDNELSMTGKHADIIKNNEVIENNGFTQGVDPNDIYNYSKMKFEYVLCNDQIYKYSLHGESSFIYFSDVLFNVECENISLIGQYVFDKIENMDLFIQYLMYQIRNNISFKHTIKSYTQILEIILKKFSLNYMQIFNIMSIYDFKKDFIQKYNDLEFINKFFKIPNIQAVNDTYKLEQMYTDIVKKFDGLRDFFDTYNANISTPNSEIRDKTEKFIKDYTEIGFFNTNSSENKYYKRNILLNFSFSTRNKMITFPNHFTSLWIMIILIMALDQHPDGDYEWINSLISEEIKKWYTHILPQGWRFTSKLVEFVAMIDSSIKKFMKNPEITIEQFNKGMEYTCEYIVPLMRQVCNKYGIMIVDDMNYVKVASGGGKYYDKYMKYKTKYMRLKNNV